MKIVFLQDDFPPISFGGAGISTYELAAGMKHAGHEVSVITTCRKQSEAGEEKYNGLTVYKIASDYNPRWRAYVSLYNPQVVRHVEQLLKKIAPDVVHVNNVHFYLSYHCLRLARRHARCVVFTARDVMAFSFGKLATKRYLEEGDYHVGFYDHLVQAKKRWNPLLYIGIRHYLAYADVITSVSDTLCEALRQNGIGDAIVVHTGMPAQPEVTEAEKEKFKKCMGVENKKVVFFGGRIRGIKGSLQTLDAMQNVKEKFSDAVLLVVGSDDEYARKMKAEAEKRGVGNMLVFTGWIPRDEMQYALSASDVVLVPSVSFDAFPRMVLEGMAAGKPVVGTCFGGAKEAIQDGVTGYIVNPLYPSEIASKTIELLKDTEKAKKFGEAGYERAFKKFNLDDKVKEYVMLYGNAMTITVNKN